MFTDNNLITLHKCREYKISNGFCKNFTYTMSIVKGGAGGISVSLASNGTASVSLNIVATLWFVLKFLYITKEFTYCRAKIIEGLLNREFIADRNTIIRDSIKSNSMWMDYKRNKVCFLETACINYLDSPENRTLLASNSNLPQEQSIIAIFNARNEIKRIFKIAQEELVRYEFNITAIEYPDVLRNEACAFKLQNIFSTNSKTGNLTDAVGQADGGK